MTEETRTEAEKLSRAEGNGDSAIAKLDKWAVREKERDDLYRRDVESNIDTRAAQKADHESAVGHRALETDRAARYEAQHEKEWAFNVEARAFEVERRDLVRREIAAFESIATSLEKLASK